MAKCIDDVLVIALRKKMREKNLDQITVAELVESAGINRKTFYNHFSSLANLICYIIQKGLKKTAGGKIEPYIWDIALKDFLYEVKENADFVRQVLESKYVSEVGWCFRRELEKEITVYVKAFKTLMEEMEGTVIELTNRQEKSLVKFYVALMFALVEDWILNGMEEPIEEYVEVVKRLASNGISAGIYFYKENNHPD
ncbi:MAG: TetR/AcrR family transcriptional regulator C-terminal domain-containing protein [Lachnospiraceae bacterium]